MKALRVFFSVVMVALTFLFTFAVLTTTAAPAKKAAPPPDPRKLIKTVDVKGSTVVVQYMRDKSFHTYLIDGLTTLTINNVPGKVDGIKPGMVVDDFLERTDKILDSLTVSGYGGTPTPAAAKPKAKPKPAAQPAAAPAQT
jgi:hypothetical protein